MRTALITGASRGIGLEFCKQLKQLGYEVFATCRKPSLELKALSVNVIEDFDVCKDDLRQKVTQGLNGAKVDLLINNAGILGNSTIEHMDFDSIRKQFEVNTLGPLKVSLALLESMTPSSKVAMISSRMGSIADNSSGSRYGYRMSKVALNMASVSLAHDLKPRGIAVGIYHPGYVKTEMTGHQGLITPEEAVKGLLKAINRLNLENSGKFFHSNGEELPW